MKLGPVRGDPRGCGRDGVIPQVTPIRRLLPGPPQPRIRTPLRRPPSRHCAGRILPGARIAVTAGSRGIHDLVPVVRAAVDWLSSVGAEPFVVPAMGSHGDATADGQREMLAGLGVTPESVGCPIEATMETVVVGTLAGRYAGSPRRHRGQGRRRTAGQSGQTAHGLPRAGRERAGEDPGDRARQPLRRGCPACRRDSRCWAVRSRPRPGSSLPRQDSRWSRRSSRTRRSGRLRWSWSLPTGIAGPAETALLQRAGSLMGRLPFDELDVLVVDEMGKDKSGAGMDTNVLGRCWVHGIPEFESPSIATVSVHRLSAASHGNASGLGPGRRDSGPDAGADRPARRVM